MSITLSWANTRRLLYPPMILVSIMENSFRYIMSSSRDLELWQGLLNKCSFGIGNIPFGIVDCISYVSVDSTSTNTLTIIDS